MKRIGLISDTHGWLDPRVRGHFESCDEIWHAGDIGNLDVLNELATMKPLRAVWGNIDGTNIRQRTEEFLWFDCEGMQVLITHIAGRPKQWSKPVLPWLKRKPDLLVCGHSHILLVKQDPHFMVKLDPLSIDTAESHVIIKDCVHVFNPQSINWTIKDTPVLSA